MSSYAANYRVILRSEVPARDAAFYSMLGAEMAGPKGAPLYQLTCTEVSFANTRYLEVRVFKEPETWLLQVFIPHDLVLLVSGPTGDALPVAFD